MVSYRTHTGALYKRYNTLLIPEIIRLPVITSCPQMYTPQASAAAFTDYFLLNAIHSHSTKMTYIYIALVQRLLRYATRCRELEILFRCGKHNSTVLCGKYTVCQLLSESVEFLAEQRSEARHLLSE